MGLFDKKFCSICGEKIGLLGNRKLDDGNLCKDCAKQLSPWFSDRRHSTVDEIREQLEWREANREKVRAFHATRSLGIETRVLLDEDAGTFMVAKGRRYEDENPDVLAIADVTGCRLDIEENHHELYHNDPQGKSVSYNPPRYEYNYNFYIVINVSNPYFDEIRFRLNPRAVDIQTGGGGSRPMMGGRPPMGGPGGPGGPGRPPMGGGGRPGGPGGAFMGGVMGGINGAFSSSTVNPLENAEYCQYKEIGDDICASLLQSRADARYNAAQANAPKAAVTCPYCGATTMPTANGCCEYCGGALS